MPLRSAIKLATRRVCARPPFCRVLCWNVACREPLVALTFDDGPTSQWTPQVLDILEKSGTPATFFVLGEFVEREPEIFRRTVAAGHEIGNHGWDHSPGGMRAQIERCDRTMRQFGVRSRLFRPPRGLLGAPLLVWLARSGYTTAKWSLDAVDSMRTEGKWQGEEPRYADVAAGDIVLLHDDNAACVRDLPVVLEAVHRKGLQPVVLSRLIGLPASS
jgi:peptidoglycan/xylan/chitin deacetylase (PgdA/CDA1 family)